MLLLKKINVKFNHNVTAILMGNEGFRCNLDAMSE